MDRKKRFKYFVCDAFRWLEYGAATLLVLVIAVPLYFGLSDMIGIEEKVDELLQYDDPEIYDQPSEEYFIEWLLDVEDVERTPADLERHRRAYRYLHSFRARVDGWIMDASMFFSFAVAITAVYTAFKGYRNKFELRERLERRLLFS
ncbi:MAG: hypothetical protein ACREX3_08285 [Gammaproteobacteria bacterium]